MNMAVRKECTKPLSIDGSQPHTRDFLRKIKATIDHEGETA
ncbi:hypothetical protein [Rhodanobacter fulvus]|nr:hypothetical protein [Rhodanobacter fulvus]